MRKHRFRNFFRMAKRAVAYMSDPDAWLQEWVTGKSVAAGVAVNEKSAFELPGVFSSITVMSKILASLPLILYRRIEPKGKERAKEHPLYRVLHLRPNSEQTAFEFKEMLMGHMMLYGNAYAEIVPGMDGTARELWPMLAWKMSMRTEGGRKFYIHDAGATERIISADKMFHIHGFSFDGVQGVRPVSYQKQSIGLGLAADEYGARYFGNDAAPGGILTTEQKLSPIARGRIKKDWEEKHQDITNKHRIAVLEEGLSWQDITASPDKAQFLQTRKYQLNETARIFDIPPHMIGDLEKATYSNIEHQGLEFLMFKLRPWLVRWEEAVTLQLLHEDEWDKLFAEFLVDAILRGDVESRYRAYRVGREIGVLSVDDVREKENMNPVEGGDKRHVPLNWVELTAEPQETPTKEEPPEGKEKPEEEPEPRDVFKVLDDVEKRVALRSAQTRSRISASYQHIMTDQIERIVKKEVSDIKNAIRKHLKSRDMTEFDVWLEEYYRGLPEYMKPRLSPVFTSLSEAVRGELAQELDINEELTPEDEKFISDYLDSFIVRYVGSSQGQIRKLSMDAITTGTDIAEYLNEKLDGWETKKAAGYGLNESVKGSNAFAKAVYIAAGITQLRWIALGPKTCPFCSQLDGSVVGIEQSFVLEGDVLDHPDGHDLKVESKIGHPPIHKGCVCQITAG